MKAPPGWNPSNSRPPRPGEYLRLWLNGNTAKSLWTGCEWQSSLPGRQAFRSPYQSLPWKPL